MNVHPYATSGYVASVVNHQNQTNKLKMICQLALADAAKRLSQKYQDFDASQLKLLNVKEKKFCDGSLEGGGDGIYEMACVDGFSVTLQYKDEMLTLNTEDGHEFIVPIT